jgi:hypothetical protein
MTMRRSIAVGAALAAMIAATPSARPLQAQQSFGSFSYTWSMPTVATNKFIDNNSWVGFAFDFRKFVNYNNTLAVGGVLAWNEFYWNTSNPLGFTCGSNCAGNVQGTQYRSFNMFPLLVGATYYAASHSGNGVRPFIGLDLGVYYMYQTFTVSASTLNTSNWIFGLAPQAGLRFSLQNGGTVSLYARYNWPVNACCFLPNQASGSYQWLSIGIALGYGS